MSSVVKDAHHDEHPSGIMRWITTTNHKDIGTLYLWFVMIMFFIGGLMALVIRSELFQPGLQFVDPQFFNSMTTMHALVMIIRSRNASFYRFGKLDDSHNDWWSGYGFAKNE